VYIDFNNLLIGELMELTISQSAPTKMLEITPAGELKVCASHPEILKLMNDWNAGELNRYGETMGPYIMIALLLHRINNLESRIAGLEPK